jgi:hypothetical protein
MLLLKWIFNALLFLWLYHAVVRPLFLGYFYGATKGVSSKPETKQKPSNMRTTPSKAQKYQADEGDYVDYEEVKK